MFIKAEDVIANPEKYLLHSRAGVDKPLSPFDGRVGAALSNGRYFITSPWEGYIPHVHMGIVEVQLRANWGFGADDVIQWPQPFHPKYCHYAVIRSKPNDCLHDENKWWNTLQVDDFEISALRGSGSIGNISKPFVRDIYLHDVQAILSRVDGHKRNPRRSHTNEAVASLSALLTSSYDRMNTLTMSFRHASILLAKFQREYLELQAALDYLQVYLPRMEGITSHSHIAPRAEVLGTILYGPHIDAADRFFSAGIPYWIVWPVSELPNRRIDSSIGMTSPSDYCCVEPAPCSTPILRCRMADETKYTSIATYYNSRLSLPNPFASEVRTSEKQVTQPLRKATRSRSLKACRAQQTFREPQHPVWPPASPLWISSLSAVDVGLSNNRWVKGYIFPDAKLFVRVDVDMRRVIRYLRWRQHLMRRLTTPGVKPISNQLWRTFLATGMAVANRHWSEADKERAAVARMLNADASLDNDDDSPPLWASRRCSLESPPSGEELSLILWEMNEINLRCELIELHTTLADPTDPFSCVACVEGCFSGDNLWKPDVNSTERGLGASSSANRAPYIYALAQLMSCWEGGHQFHYTRRSPYAEALSPVMQAERDQLETLVAKFYLQNHFNVFNRAACIPRHLAIA